MAAARSGSPEAFRQLVARHQQAVRSFLRRVLSDAADADDLAQETFLAAWSRLWRFRGTASFRTWLCAIAWNKALSFSRSRGRERKRADALDAPLAVGGGCSDARLDLARALGGLPPDQRAAVALCLGGEFSHAEAAEALGLPLGTIKSHVQRGRAKLLQALGGPDD